MNPRLAKLNEKIKNGQPVIGLFTLLADSSVSEIIGYSGCDFVWIDSEHGMLDRREIYQHVLAAQAAGACAFVRVPSVDPGQIKNTLDMGPDGVIFPFIDTPELARAAVKACTYPADGGKRGIGPLRAIKYGIDYEPDYLKVAKDEVWKIFQIESMEAAENLEEIAAVEGYHSLFVGPADLGMSMVDVDPAKKGEIIADVQRRTAELCKKYGKIAGTFGGPSRASWDQLSERGMQWICVGQDVRILSDWLTRVVKEING